MTYTAFKAAVLKAAGYQCENPNCGTGQDLTVHHFLKQSTYPQWVKEPRNGMCTCGPCHSEIERRLREGGDVLEMYPIGRYRVMLDAAGLEGLEP